MASGKSELTSRWSGPCRRVKYLSVDRRAYAGPAIHRRSVIPAARMPLFRQVNPILGTRDVDRAVSFYVDRLGLRLKFRSGAPPAEYVGFGRDGVELHMQFQSPHEMGTIRLRIQGDDPDALHAEYRDRDVFCDRTELRDTPWGTREFALYDPDRNALTFYADLGKPA